MGRGDRFKNIKKIYTYIYIIISLGIFYMRLTTQFSSPKCRRAISPPPPWKYTKDTLAEYLINCSVSCRRIIVFPAAVHIGSNCPQPLNHNIVIINTNLSYNSQPNLRWGSKRTYFKYDLFQLFWQTILVELKGYKATTGKTMLDF